MGEKGAFNKWRNLLKLHSWEEVICAAKPEVTQKQNADPCTEGHCLRKAELRRALVFRFRAAMTVPLQRKVQLLLSEGGAIPSCVRLYGTLQDVSTNTHSVTQSLWQHPIFSPASPGDSTRAPPLETHSSKNEKETEEKILSWLLLEYQNQYVFKQIFLIIIQPALTSIFVDTEIHHCCAGFLGWPQEKEMLTVSQQRGALGYGGRTSDSCPRVTTTTTTTLTHHKAKC